MIGIDADGHACHAPDVEGPAIGDGDRLGEFLATIKAALVEYDAGRREEAAGVGAHIPEVRGLADVDPARLLEELGNRGVVVLRTETLREMERATRDAIAAVGIGRRPGREPIWGVFEQLGHNKYPGKITVETLAGSESYRIDVPDGDGWVTHYVGGGTMYGIHPCSEQVVRHLAAQWGPPEPAHPWELKGLGGADEDARPAIGQASSASTADPWRPSDSADEADDYADEDDR